MQAWRTGTFSTDKQVIGLPLRRMQYAKPSTVSVTALLGIFKSAFNRQAETATSLQDIQPEFKDWVTANGAVTDKVVLQACDSEGRGLVAAKHIKKGQMVLSVPGSLIIDARVAAAGSSLLQGPESAGNNVLLPEWELITVYLAELRYWAGQLEQDSFSTDLLTPAAMAAQKWLPYIRILPEKLDIVLSWPHGQAGQLLAGSCLASKAASLQQSAQAAWSLVAPLIQAAEQEGRLPVGAITQLDMTWALEIMLSRAIRLTSRGDSLALVPWADFLNHNPTCNAHLDWQRTTATSYNPMVNGSSQISDVDGAVVLLADQHYNAGQQVYVSYGARSSGDLLLSYGFAPTDNPHDNVMIPIGLQPSDPLKDEKALVLARLGLPQCGNLPLRIDGLPAGLLAWAAFCAPAKTLPKEWHDVDRLAATLLPYATQQKKNTHTEGMRQADEVPFNQMMAAVAAPEQSIPVELQAVGFKRISSACVEHLKGYPGSLEQDRQQADMPLSNEEDITARLRKMCAGIRLRERQILARVVYVMSSKARQLTRAGKR